MNQPPRRSFLDAAAILWRERLSRGTHVCGACCTVICAGAFAWFAGGRRASERVLCRDCGELARDYSATPLDLPSSCSLAPTGPRYPRGRDCEVTHG